MADTSLAAFLDTLLPGDADWPSATVALRNDEAWLAGLTDAERRWLREAAGQVAACEPAARVRVAKALEDRDAATFSRVVQAVYDAYYAAEPARAAALQLAAALPRDLPPFFDARLTQAVLAGQRGAYRTADQSATKVEKMTRRTEGKLLLTPGPVSVSATTRQVMLEERASGDTEFREDLALARSYLLQLVNGGDDYAVIPLPGSATYANEAVIAALVPTGATLLIHSNGVYGDRLIEICETIGTAVRVVRTDPFVPLMPPMLADVLDADPAISHVMLVHCETSTGVMNPLEDVSAVCRAKGKRLLVDAVASYGAWPIDAPALGLEAITLSSNKCMEGVPGVGWAVVRRAALAGARRHSLSLDLADQERHLAATGTLRYTPPVQVLAAFAQACREHAEEGGVPARLARYRRNWRRLVDGMRQMGFRTVVPDAASSPIVATFHNPADPAFSFEKLFTGMKRRGFIIFPGRLALADTFRIGCMGAVTEEHIAEAMEAVAETMAEMGVSDLGRAEAVAGGR